MLQSHSPSSDELMNLIGSATLESLLDLIKSNLLESIRSLFFLLFLLLLLYTLLLSSLSTLLAWTALFLRDISRRSFKDPLSLFRVHSLDYLE